MKEVIGFASWPDFSGNSKALYEDMNNKNGKYDLVWFCKEQSIADRLNKKGIKAIWDKSENFEKEFSKVKIMINTHDDYLDLKKENQIFIDLWHGLGPKRGGVLLEEEVDWNYKFSTKNDYLIATSEFGRMVFSSIFNIPIYRVKQFPQARYKWLFENKGRENLEKVLKKDLKEYNKILMYAPTFKQGLGKEEATVNKDNLLNLNKYDEQVLIDYLEKNDILLILKLHPSEQNKVKEEKSNNVVVLKDDVMLDEFVTINEVLSGVDLLISDYSSIFVDYINLERPVIFFDTDKEEYEKNRGIIFNTLDFWWMAGPKVHSLDKFIEETEKLFIDKNYYKNEREKFNKLVNGNKNKSNKDLIKFISNIESVDKDNSYTYEKVLLEKKNKQLKMEVQMLEEEKQELQNKNEILEGQLDIVRRELDSIKYSRSYKLMMKIKKII